MAIITFASSKGGAGKTTIAQLVLGTIHHMGYSVGVLDCDRNTSMTDWVKTISRLPIECHATTDEAEIAPIAAELEEKHDLVVIDTAGAQSQATVFAIGCADLVLIPVKTSSANVVETIKTYKLVVSASGMVKREIPARAVLNDYSPNTNIATYVTSELEKYEIPMLNNGLTRLVGFQEFTFTGDIPRTGPAADQLRLLVDELKSIGILPFLSETTERTTA